MGVAGLIDWCVLAHAASSYIPNDVDKTELLFRQLRPANQETVGRERILCGDGNPSEENSPKAEVKD